MVDNVFIALRTSSTRISRFFLNYSINYCNIFAGANNLCINWTPERANFGSTSRTVPILFRFRFELEVGLIRGILAQIQMVRGRDQIKNLIKVPFPTAKAGALSAGITFVTLP
ncbi:hypothetical protein EVAR_25998_1 [Eumeta japonica]|uniref:Uncharacterized protein n=1 Tax=Eumeta variegata TaxID=151549 RepID=A0A4C1V2W8_EUMVA|nr:hypothetical protein EVAR_25998_1 [Eumeta japonica]